MYERDEAKRRENIRRHGIDFAVVEDIDWDNAVTFEDLRQRYAEQRWVAFGPIGPKLYALVFTERGGDVTRVISLREATKRKKRLCAQEIQKEDD
jgi:uncharacterized DUF497 family protein